MSQYITDAALSHMQQLTVPAYMDTALRGVYTEGSGSYGYGTPTYPDGVSFACLFVPRAQPDALAGTNVPVTDADLFFAATVTLTANDRVTITHLHGEAVDSPQTFAIVAGPVQTHIGQQATLRLVQE